jgi:hypothetical protein
VATDLIKEAIYSYKDTIDYSLNEQYAVLAHRALNKYHVGKETIPLKKPVPDLLRQCTHNLHMVNRKEVFVTVYSDGSIKLEFCNE